MLDRVKRDFLFDEIAVERQGAEIHMHVPDYRRILALHIFCVRFGLVFPLEDGEETDAELGEAFAALEDSILSAIAQPSGVLFHRGAFANFQESDLTRAESVDEEFLRTVERDLTALGLEPLGDFVCDKFPDVVLRGYGNGRDLYATLMFTTFGQNALDFYTSWDSASLTTSSGGDMQEIPSAGLYHTLLHGAQVELLYRTHLERLAELMPESAQASEAPPTRIGIAQAIDAFLVRLQEANART